MFEPFSASKIAIEDVAQSLKISMSLLRFWEDEFVLPKRKNGKITRLEEAEIRLIHNLIQDKGLTLEDAKLEFSLQRPHLEVRFRVLEKLETIRENLASLKSSL